jgi:hypothetical protein
LAEVSDEQFEALLNIMAEVKGEITTAAMMRGVAGEQRGAVHKEVPASGWRTGTLCKDR